jgi:hypothetical protein
MELNLETKHHAAITSLVAPAHRLLDPYGGEWDYLWQAGQSAMLVRKTCSAGGLDVLSVDLDAEAWTRLITGGLAERVIQLESNRLKYNV